MEAFELLRINLFSPMVLAFALGVVATGVRSDLRFPDALYAALSIYLLLAIGLKGGTALAATPPSQLWLPALVTMGVGSIMPVWCFALLRRLGRLTVPDAAAMAAHYGSVSVVTFIACQAFLDRAGVPYEGFMVTLVALLEVPAILVALLIARAGPGAWGSSAREVLAGRSILLLVGGLVIGAAAGPAGMARVEPFFVTPFEGVLTLFLLEMGLVTARRFGELRRIGPFLLGFGVVMPFLHGTLGILLGPVIGLSVGGSVVLAVLFASASYIAATAAVRLALPEANPSIYLTSSLAITFPFNLVVGIPLYARIAQAVWGPT